MTALDVAKYLLSIAYNNTGRTITNLGIQKLVYYSYTWYLVLNKKKLFKEQIEAWKYGPVIKTVYDEFKQFNDQDIPFSQYSDDVFIKPEIKVFLEAIWVEYGKFIPVYLIKKTHYENGIGITPWQRVYQEDKNNIIKDEDILDYYDIYKNSGLLDNDVIIDQENNKLVMRVLSENTKKAMKESIDDCEDFIL